VTDAGVVPLLRGSPQLETLSLYWNLNVSDAVLTVAASSCPALRSVNVSGCKRISDVGAAALAAACPQLTELDLTRCQVAVVHWPPLHTHCPPLRMCADQAPICD
jgi:F-box and leucine-rich repeat protein 2/20